MQVAAPATALSKVISSGDASEPLTLEVRSLEARPDGRYKGSFAEGRMAVDVMLASQLSELARSGTLCVGCTIKVKTYSIQKPSNHTFLMVTDLEVLSGAGKGAPDADTASANPHTPAPHKASTASKAKENVSPPEPSPSEQPAKFAKTPQGAIARPAGAADVTPPAPPSVSAQTKGLVPFMFLNPYDSDMRCKAKLSKKYPIRQLNNSKKMMVEFIDEKGSQIQGTFWRDAADRFDQVLTEGCVYIIGKFTVKPANKQYATVINDYELHFSDKSEVQVFVDQSAADSMSANLNLVPIMKLPQYVTRKAPVDVLGVVVSMGTTGTIKRKADQAEFTRRDVTIADKSGKSVQLTLWNDLAVTSEGEIVEGMVIQVTACRVTDYNGCSLSTLTKSQVNTSPSSPAAIELAAWWSEKGQSSSIIPLSEAPKAAGDGSGVSNRNQLHTLDKATDQVLELDAKPTYHNVLAVVVSISPDQSMYYLANPQNGKKVVERNGHYEEADGKVVDTTEHRYVMQARGVDVSGPAYLSFFNDQAQLVMGMSADTLAALKANDEDAYKAACVAAHWGEWAITVQSKPREYNGERKLRHTVFAARAVDYAEDGRRLLAAIQGYAVRA